MDTCLRIAFPPSAALSTESTAKVRSAGRAGARPNICDSRSAEISARRFVQSAAVRTGVPSFIASNGGSL